VSTDSFGSIEAIVEREVAAYREVPGLLERDLPLGVAWLRLQAEGRPLTVQEFAAVLGWPAEKVAEQFVQVAGGTFADQLSPSGSITPDQDGRVVIEDDPDMTLPGYRIRWLDNGQLGKLPGCSDDALVAVLLAGRPARVELPCPATRKVISLEFGPDAQLRKVDPQAAVAVMRRPDVAWSPRDWIRSDCGNGLLFASADAAAGWLAEHPDATVVPVDFFARLSLHKFRKLLAFAIPGVN
jgi:alkylmercury lyase